jgi:Ca2+-binding RTX toxin-like protein
MKGTSGDDALTGTPSADRLTGAGGNDRLSGMAGNDVLIGGTGQDRLVGGTGDDRIGARDGERDIVDCGPGRDRVTADSLDAVRGNCEVVLRPSTPAPPAPTPPPPAPPAPPNVTPGAYQGQTQNGNYVFFTVSSNRTATGFRVNDIPGTCNGPLRIVGGRDWGTSVFPIDSTGRFSAEYNWSGSDMVGDLEWTRWHEAFTAYFNNPTTVTGTYVWSGEANLNGSRYNCTSGTVSWSASLKP